MATRAEILGALLFELNRFDEHLGILLRANRRQIVATEARIGDSFEHIASSDIARRRLNGVALPPRAPSRHR